MKQTFKKEIKEIYSVFHKFFPDYMQNNLKVIDKKFEEILDKVWTDGFEFRDKIYKKTKLIKVRIINKRVTKRKK